MNGLSCDKAHPLSGRLFSLRERHEPFGEERVKGSEGSKQAHFFMEIVYRHSDKNPPP